MVNKLPIQCIAKIQILRKMLLPDRSTAGHNIRLVNALMFNRSLLGSISRYIFLIIFSILSIL